MNTLMFQAGVVLAAAKGDMQSWGLNLAALPRETIYLL